MTQEKKTILLVAGLLAFIAIVYFAFGRRSTNPAARTMAQLQTLETAVIDHADRTGSLPESLEDLGLDAEVLSDRAGNRFVYQVNGNTVSISSLGADGKEGGHVFDADRTVKFTWPAE